MQAFHNVYQGVRDYYLEIPSNFLKQTVINTTTSFVIETIFSGKPSQGLVTAGLTAIATAVYALITPIFKWVGCPPQLDWPEELCRRMISIISAGCVGQAFGNDSILQRLISTALIQFLIGSDPRCSTLNSVNFISIFPDFKIIN